MRRKRPSFLGEVMWAASLAFSLRLLFCDQPGTEYRPSQDSTILDMTCLCEPLVDTISMQADGVFLVIKAAYGAQQELTLS
jgi:hypothetical protein